MPMHPCSAVCEEAAELSNTGALLWQPQSAALHTTVEKAMGQKPFIAVFHSCFILPAPLIFTMIENSTFPRASEGNLPKFKVSLTQTALLLLGPFITMVDANT